MLSRNIEILFYNSREKERKQMSWALCVVLYKQKLRLYADANNKLVENGVLRPWTRDCPAGIYVFGIPGEGRAADMQHAHVCEHMSVCACVARMHMHMCT